MNVTPKTIQIYLPGGDACDISVADIALFSFIVHKVDSAAQAFPMRNEFSKEAS